MNPTPDSIAEAAGEIRRRIASAGGDPDQVSIVAVTKNFPAGVAAAAYDAGLRILGENYAGELIDKAGALADRIRPGTISERSRPTRWLGWLRSLTALKGSLVSRRRQPSLGSGTGSE